jgi:uncharacterized membrane protein YdjX (TVP38/TMEM64 family)
MSAMSNLVAGIFIGAFIMFFVNKLVMSSYKRILVMKAHDKTAEHINGHFYYIVPESEYNKSNLNK